MQTSGWIQLAFYVAALAAITKPMGLYLLRVLDANGRTWLDPVLKPLERFTYRALGVDVQKEQDWKQYTFAMLIFSLVSCLFTYAILRLQNLLPLNPQHFGALSPDLAFNTAVSFTTNTNWQSYSGESTMSYFSQMVGLAFHNFASAAVGIALAAALVRGIARHSAQTLGNFWVDLVRVTYYLLLPICLVFAVFLVSQGMIQNFKPYTQATTLEGVPQTIAQGPMASQVAIKMLGTNGGGFMNANAAHPFENPTPLSNFFQMLSIFAIRSGLTYYLGRMVKNQKHGWAVWAAMMILFLGGTLFAGGRKRKEIRYISNLESLRPTATWKARKSASAFSIRPCSRPSRPTHPAARSIPCTIPSLRSVDLFRCSTFSLAKLFLAALARDFTE